MSVMFAVVHSVFELSQKESSMSLRVESTVNMTSMCSLLHAVGSVVSSVLQQWNLFVSFTRPWLQIFASSESRFI